MGAGAVVFNSYHKLNAQLLEKNSHAVCCDLMVEHLTRMNTNQLVQQAYNTTVLGYKAR